MTSPLYYLTQKSTSTLFCSRIFIYYDDPSILPNPQIHSNSILYSYLSVLRRTDTLFCSHIFLYYDVPSLLSKPEIHSNSIWVVLSFYTMKSPLYYLTQKSTSTLFCSRIYTMTIPLHYLTQKSIDNYALQPNKPKLLYFLVLFFYTTKSILVDLDTKSILLEIESNYTLECYFYIL